MYEWNYEVQKMIDFIEEHISENPTLDSIAQSLHYSKFYCSRQFRLVVGMTLKRYIAGRRLYYATIQVRDTKRSIIDIALECGYSSQVALTRAFRYTYGCTPAVYRKYPVPIPLPIRKVVLNPSHYVIKGVVKMSESILTNPQIWVEHIPAHKFIGLYDINAKGYWDFAKRPDCDEIEGVLESFIPFQHPVVWSHHAGWYYQDGTKGYFYGTGVPTGYTGVVPSKFEMRDVPESYYLVFGHPKYDYLRDNDEVMRRVEDLAWNFDPRSMGYEWNETLCQDYQRHMWKDRGYQVLRPIKKL